MKNAIATAVGLSLLAAIFGLTVKDPAGRPSVEPTELSIKHGRGLTPIEANAI